MGDSCLICGSTSAERTLFKFPPQRSTLYAEWLAKLPDEFKFKDYLSSYSWICEDHFVRTAKCVQLSNLKVTLKRSAVPTIFRAKKKKNATSQPAEKIQETKNPETIDNSKRKEPVQIIHERNPSLDPDIFHCCRFCLEFKEEKHRVQITEDIKHKFQDLTQNELQMSPDYSAIICDVCFEKLMSSCTFKNQILSNQSKWYESEESEIEEDQEQFEANFQGYPETLETTDSQTMDVEESELKESPEKDGNSASTEENDGDFEPIEENDGDFEPSEAEESDEDYEQDSDSSSGSNTRRKSKSKGQKNFECSICFRKLQTKESLKRHMGRIHSGNPDRETKVLEAKEFRKERILCPHCGNSYTRDSLKAHVDRKHLNVKNFFCDLCPFGGYHKYHIVNHMMAVHLSIRNFQCKICSRRFPSPAALGNHHFSAHRKEENNAQNVCQYCQKNFRRKMHLSRHIKQFHFKEAKFVCEIDNCGKFYNCRKKFNNHQSMHSDPTLPCDICNKLFHNADNLKYHKMLHSKRFQCSVCQKDFVNNDKLNLHMKVHLGKRDFNCSYCEKAYFRRNHLNTHIKKSHPDKVKEN